MSLILLSTWSIFFGRVSQGDHSEPLLPLALFYQSTPSCLKVIGGWVAHVILVSAQVLLVLTLGLWTLDSGLGLDNSPTYDQPVE